MQTEPKHVTSDDARTIQLAVHEIAKKWMADGYCPGCIVNQLVTGATAVAQDAAHLPADAVHELVDDAYDILDSAIHVPHDSH
jgi:hypothetical protein